MTYQNDNPPIPYINSIPSDGTQGGMYHTHV